jgi:hypothetical protein
MDSFIAVPPTLGYSSMYKTEWELMSRVDVSVIAVNMSAYD